MKVFRVIFRVSVYEYYVNSLYLCKKRGGDKNVYFFICLYLFKEIFEGCIWNWLNGCLRRESGREWVDGGEELKGFFVVYVIWC